MRRWPAAKTKGTETASEITGGGNEVQGEDKGEDEAREVKSEALWGVLAEATDPDFGITDAEHEAFSVLMAAIGDEDRAVRVLLHSIWNII